MKYHSTVTKTEPINPPTQSDQIKGTGWQLLIPKLTDLQGGIKCGFPLKVINLTGSVQGLLFLTG